LRIIGVDWTTSASPSASAFRPYPSTTSIDPSTRTATVSFVHTAAATGTFTVTARAICSNP
jgi:hypothetical protein